MQKAMKSVGPSKSKHAHIVGWGADLDPAQRPGVPKEFNRETVMSPHHHKAIVAKQKLGRDINLTIERAEMPPVFGNTTNPRPLSTPLRKLAFRYSEDKLRHWMLLLFADRVNMVEGWFEDIGQGKMPMILPRMEFRTTDHLRRILQQGPKNKQDKMLLAGAALTLVGAGYLAFRLLARPNRR